MKAVVAALCLGQGHANTLGVGGAHVLANMLDLFWLTPVRLQVSSKVEHALMVAPLAGKQQALGVRLASRSSTTVI